MGAFLSLPGVIITGTISDYIGRELSAIVTYGTSIIGVVFALLITQPGPAPAAVAARLLLRPDLGCARPGDHSQNRRPVSGPNLGAILGVITIGTGLGSAVGSWLAGFVFDVTGSYRVAFWLSIFFYLCGAVAFWALRRPPVTRR